MGFGKLKIEEIDEMKTEKRILVLKSLVKKFMDEINRLEDILCDICLEGKCSHEECKVLSGQLMISMQKD
jgi:hypothetical protein